MLNTVAYHLDYRRILLGREPPSFRIKTPKFFIQFEMIRVSDLPRGQVSPTYSRLLCHPNRHVNFPNLHTPLPVRYFEKLQSTFGELRGIHNGAKGEEIVGYSKLQ